MSVVVLFSGLCLALAVLALSSRVRRFVRVAGDRTLRTAVRSAALVSRVANFLFAPRQRDGRVGPARLVVWGALNVSALIAAGAPFSPMAGLPPAIAVCVCLLAALVNFLLISASLLKIHEDNDVLNGLVREGERRFGDNPAVGSPLVVALSIVFLVLFIAAALEGFDRIYPLVAARPDSGIDYLDYLLATLSTLPLTNLLVIGATWGAGQAGYPATDIAFAAGWGSIVAHAIFFIGSFFLIGLVTLRLRQKRDTYRLIEKLIRSSEEPDVHYLKARIARAPSFVNPLILNAAVTPTAVGNQLHAIDAAIQQELFTFPMLFCRRLDRQKNLNIRLEGLKKVHEFIDRQGDRFEPALATQTLAAVAVRLNKRRQRSRVALGLSRVMLTLLQRARTRGFAGVYAGDWLRQPALASLPDRILALALAEGRDKDNELQLLAIDVGLRYGIYEVPQRFIERSAEFRRETQVDGIERITAWLDAESEYFRTGAALPLIRAIDVRLDDKRRRPHEEVHADLLNLKATAQRGHRTYFTRPPAGPTPAGRALPARRRSLWRRVLRWLPRRRRPATV